MQNKVNRYVKIGNVTIEKTAALAPMASVADRAYRLVCKKFKAALVVSEMVSVKGVFYDSKQTEKLLYISEEERPMAIQLFGEDPKFFELALPKVLKFAPNIIDINMGCPVKKVVSTGAGASLMKNIKLAEKIVSVVIKNSNVPVTVKIRKGWDKNTVNVCEFAKRMEYLGVSAITIHPRTKEQMFSGKADLKIIEDVKKSVSIPIIANGDINSVEAAKRVYDITGADLIMIGRGSFGRPFLFEQISDFFKIGSYVKEFSTSYIVDVMLYHIKKIIEFEGMQKGIKKARSAAMRYFYGIKNAATIRNICSKINSFDDVLELAYFVKKINNNFDNLS